MTKWFNGTPASEANKRKRSERKKLKTQEANISASAARSFQSVNMPIIVKEWVPEAAKAVEDSDQEDMLMDDEDESDSSADIVEGDLQPTKRAKTLPEFTAYVDIVSPPRTSRRKESSTSCGPFFFNPETTHDKFLGLLAACAVDQPHFSASIEAIVQSQLTWKLNTPANDKKKPLSTEQGYRALLKKMDELAKKKKECTVTLTMPPLSKIVKGSKNVCIY